MSAKRAEQEKRAEDAKQHGMNPRTTSSCYGRGVMYGGMGAYDAPLHLAAKSGNAEAVRDLVLARANVNSKREVCCRIALSSQALSACCLQDKSTPLHIAAERCHLQAIMCLLSAKADVNARNLHGNTPLAAAKFNNRVSKADKERVIEELESDGGRQ